MNEPTESGAPGTESVLPGRADAAGWRRLHPLSPLLRGGIALLVVIGIIIANFRDRFVQLFVSDSVWGEASDYGGDPIDILVREGLLLLAIGAVLGIILLVVLFSWISWRFQSYRVTDDLVEERSGVLFRKHRRAPLERVQSVNLQRSLFARILGLTKVEVVTAGQGGKVELAYLGYRDAQTARAEILRRARVAHAADLPPTEATEVAVPAVRGVAAQSQLSQRADDFLDDDVDQEALATRALVRVPVGRLIGSILIGWEAVVVLALLLVLVGGGFTGIVALFTEDTAAGLFWGMLAVGAAPLIIVFLGIMFAQFNRGFRFTVSRGADALRIGSGLTSTTTESIPFGRVHALEIRQPITWRPLGWWKIRITQAGHTVAQGGQNSPTQNLVLPVGRLDDVLRVLEALMPNFGDDAAREALVNGLTGPGAGYQGSGARSVWVLWWGKRRAGIRIDVADTGDSLTNATLRIRRGAVNRSLSIMPLVRAQSVVWSRPLIHRCVGLASVQAHTVMGPVRMEMRGLDLTASRRVFHELEAAVLRVQLADGQRLRGRGEPR